jgi:hypothetical protein
MSTNRFEITGTFHHIFYAPIDEKKYSDIKLSLSIDEDELGEITEDSPEYLTFFGPDIDDVTLSYGNNEELTSDELQKIAESNIALSVEEGTVVDFTKNTDTFWIIGHSTYVGSDYCSFKESFDKEKLTVYNGEFRFGNSDKDDIRFLQIFYEESDIEEGSEIESREIFIFNSKDGLLSVDVD